ncbi:carbonic anhydrase [Gephyromycinifex aptenodytis]|uniref:carbonic anhydrase n=1 Tax=Gephyromycinifex aptenodytis TaxID=2716227 RepID=UPI001447D0CA|nr:carbonic anhydrase [Gephyromycinifex aptenodytis]
MPPSSDLPTPTPAQAWRLLASGNTRFVSDRPRHPHNSMWRRSELRTAQHPFATIFGCSDSRVPPEIIFDRGLGDLFTVRTAGHVLDGAALGTLEYGVSQCGTPLLAVIGHEECGAVAATLKAVSTGNIPTGHIGTLVEAIAPSVASCADAGVTCFGEVMEENIRFTLRQLLAESPVVADAVEAGTLGVVGLSYLLQDGRVRMVDWLGDLGPDPAAQLRQEASPEAAIMAQQAAAAAVERAAVLVTEPVS